MALFAIGDLHLALSDTYKPMDIFNGWEGYTEKLEKNWRNTVGADDTVVLAGDISWAMRLEDAKADLDWIDGLPGTKIILRGNHDYWWSSLTRVRSAAGRIHVVQNDAHKIGDYIFCGSRGWLLPGTKGFKADDAKIYTRELLRLKLSLDAAKRLQNNNEKIIVAMHFPPLDSVPDKGYEELFVQYGIDTVIYGHIHGARVDTPIREINGIKYYITSCDLLNFDPLEIV